MGWWDTIVDWGKGAYDFYDKNSDDIGKIANFGNNVYRATATSNARTGFRDAYSKILEQAAAQDAAYQDEYRKWQEGQYAASQGAAASRAAAARANMAAAQKAAKKAMGQKEKGYNKLISNFDPYVNAGKMLAPEMAQNYKGFLDSTSMLNQYLTPKVMENMQQGQKPVWDVAVPKSAYEVSAPTGATINPQDLQGLLTKLRGK
jgi:hypothetical protein